MNQSSADKAFNKALHYLSYKMRTKKEVADYLRRKEFLEEDIETTINKLLEYQLIDDQQYAEYYIREKFTINNQGRYKIYSHLYYKGIPSETIKLKLDECLDKEIEEQKIEELFLKKNPEKGNLEEKELFKIYKYLIRKGFPADKVRSVIRKYTHKSDS